MDAPARIIDANANRAREGVRTMEDVARFAFDDAGLAEDLKQIRHAVTRGVEGLPISPGGRLSSRDAPGDVGTALPDLGAGRRGLAPMIAAAAARAGEALRVLEETAKALGADPGAFMRARYRVYDHERTLTVRAAARPGQWAVCVIVTASMCAGRAPAEIVRLAIEGGADCVQVREKSLDARAFVEIARSVVEAARPADVPVIVNDRADVALAAGADGVHVGQDDLSVTDARRVLGEGAIVGVSASTMDRAVRAVGDGASYCGLGSMFASATKPKPELAGIDHLRAYLADERTRAVPHLAIGGITPANVGELAKSGCRGVAVSGAVCGADDPVGVCRALAEAVRSAPRSP